MSSLILKPVNASCPSRDPSNGVGPLSRVPDSSRREFVAKQEPILRATVVRDARGEFRLTRASLPYLLLGGPVYSSAGPLSRRNTWRAAPARLGFSFQRAAISGH